MIASSWTRAAVGPGVGVGSLVCDATVPMNRVVAGRVGVPRLAGAHGGVMGVLKPLGPKGLW